MSLFLSSLMFCYIVFPFAFRHANRRTLLMLLGYYIIIYVIVPYNMVNAILYVSPLVRIVDFFLGIMLYKIYINRSDSSNASMVSLAELLLAILLILALIAYPYTDEKLRNAPLYWFVLLPIIYVFTQQKGIVSRCVQCKILQWLGSLSMPVFMLHPIVFRTMFHFFPSIPSILMLALCFSITVMLSWATDLLFLRHIERLRKLEL